MYGKTKAEFEANKSMAKSDLMRGTYANDKGFTVRQYAKHWYDTYKAGKSGYENIIKNHFGTIGQIRLKDLTKTDVQKQLNALDGHYDLQRRLLMTLNQMIECAIDDNLVYRNVCRTVKLPPKPRSKKRALYEHEINAIRAALSQKEKAFVDTLYYLGVRRGEALSLKKSNFDFKNNIVRITNAVSYEKEKPVFADTKTEAGERSIVLIEPYRTTIKKYVDECGTLFLFPNRSGNLMSKTSFRQFWKGIMRKINTAAGGIQKYNPATNKYDMIIDAVPGLTPHIFRHNYATNLYYAGVDLKEAQRLLGHADAKTVIEIYTHLDKEKSNSAPKIEEYFKKICL